MNHLKQFTKELIAFGLKEAQACVFAGSFFVLLFLSHYVTFGFYRYDFLFLGAIVIQLILIALKLETWDEVKVILLFHIIGFALEAFKTHPAIGSWSYPEPGFFKVFNVPLYSGFMYSAVGSYIAQAWRILKLRLVNPPPYWQGALVAVLIYLNFFTHHWLPDIRYILMLAVLWIYRRTWIEFVPLNIIRKMPLTLGFVLTGFFIWVAENMATYLGAWKYPDQVHAWTTVSLHKVGAWSLLVIFSFMLIAWLKHYKEEHRVSSELKG